MYVTPLISPNNLGEEGAIICILQMKILRYREVESFAQGNTHRKYQSQSVRLPGGCACPSRPVSLGKPVQSQPFPFPFLPDPTAGIFTHR